MARIPRAEVFSPDEIAVVHVINRCCRSCYLMGEDPISGRNYDHRKRWLEERLELLAATFGIDLLAYAILSNHFHLVLRSRPDVVQTWDDTQVARRWLAVCPLRRDSRGQAAEPSDADLDTIRRNPQRLAEIRSRLFYLVAGRPSTLSNHKTRLSQRPFYVPRAASQLFASSG